MRADSVQASSIAEPVGAGAVADVPAVALRPGLAAEPWTLDLRQLLLIAMANVASTVTQTLMSFVDYWIVSQLPQQSAAQAAVSSGGLLYFTVFGFVLGTMVCTTTVVSQSLGARRHRDCSAYAWQGIWLSLVFGVLGFVLWPAVPTIFAWIGHDPLVQAMETGYTRVRLLSLWAAGATVAMGHYFIGIHRPWQDTASAVTSNIVNALVSYPLVLGVWGFPALGVEGAAWGTVVATVFRMAWLLVAMCFGRYAAEFHARHTWRWDREKARRLIAVGWPAGAAFVLDIGAWATFMVGIVGMFGTIHLAASATVWRFTELSFMPAIGIGLAVSTVVGKAIGEGRPDLARRRARIGTRLNMGYMGLMAFVFLLFGRFLMRIFSSEPPVIELGVELLVFAAVFQMFDAVAITYSNALRGAGDTRWPAVVGPAQSWVIMIAGGSLIAHFWPEIGSRGPWFFATLFVITIGITFWLRWRQGVWETLDVIGRTEPNVPDYQVTPTELAVVEPATPPEYVEPAEPPRIGSSSG